MAAPRKILFFKFGAMGDVLMCTPLLRQTRRIFLNAEIDFLVAEGFDAVLRGNPYLNTIRNFDPEIFTGRKVSKLWSLARSLRGYDLVFVLDKHWSFAAVARLAGIPVRIGFSRDTASRLFLTSSIPYGPVRHEVHYYLDLLATLTPVDRDDVAMDFFLDRTAPASVELPTGYVVCINSGGKNLRESSAIRMLPLDFFRDLVRDLQKHHPVVLLGNAEDRVCYESVGLSPDTLNLAGTLDLAGSVQVMRHAAHVFTTDSGAMHLAGVTQTPMTVFFGPTHPLRKAPLRKNVQVIWTDENFYEDNYETHGLLPIGKTFFSQLSLNAINASDTVPIV